MKGLTLCFVVAATLLTTPCLAEPKVPFKSKLKARVSQFYTAYDKQDWPILYELVAPFVRGCESPKDFRLKWSVDGPKKVLSWRFVDMKSDSTYVGLRMKVECAGQTFRIDSGALVVVSRRTQEGDSQPEDSDSLLHWVLVDGVWFALGPY